MAMNTLCFRETFGRYDGSTTTLFAQNHDSVNNVYLYVLWMAISTPNDLVDRNVIFIFRKDDGTIFYPKIVLINGERLDRHHSLHFFFKSDQPVSTYVIWMVMDETLTNPHETCFAFVQNKRETMTSIRPHIRKKKDHVNVACRGSRGQKGTTDDNAKVKTNLDFLKIPWPLTTASSQEEYINQLCASFNARSTIGSSKTFTTSVLAGQIIYIISDTDYSSMIATTSLLGASFDPVIIKTFKKITCSNHYYHSYYFIVDGTLTLTSTLSKDLHLCHWWFSSTT